MGGQRGQAAAELAALLPLVVLVVALIWQFVLAGHAVWSVGAAARAAARAEAVGGEGLTAARRELHAGLRGSVRVRSRERGVVEVSARIPSLLPGVRFGRASAAAHFEPQS